MQIELQWNEDYYAEYQLTDLSSAPISLFGATISGQVRLAAGVSGPPLLTMSCAIVDVANGIFSAAIPRGAISAISGGEAMLQRAYDILVIDETNNALAALSGAFVVAPGVTLD